jgi:hypothetical protein
MREARYHAIGLFDCDEEEDRRAEHEDVTKTPVPFDFAPKGLNKSAQGRGDASCASVAVALGTGDHNAQARAMKGGQVSLLPPRAQRDGPPHRNRID